MAGRTIPGRILVAFVGVLLAAPPVAQIALAAGAPGQTASAPCDQDSAPTDDCDCCAGEADVAGLSKCLAFCYGAYVVPIAPGAGPAAADRRTGRLRADIGVQRITAPEPGPPKPDVFSVVEPAGRSASNGAV